MKNLALALLTLATVANGVGLYRANTRAELLEEKLTKLEQQKQQEKHKPFAADRRERRTARVEAGEEEEAGAAEANDSFFSSPSAAIVKKQPVVVEEPADVAASPERVSVLVREELRRQEQERDQQREDRRTQRLVERVDSFASEHSLSPQQSQKLTTMLVAEQSEIRTIMQEARETDSFDGVREKMLELRKKTDESAHALFDDDEQKAAFDAMREEEAQRFRGRGFGGGDRDRARGNNEPGTR